MRTTVIIFALSALVLSCASTQDTDTLINGEPPEAVQKVFEKTYPEAKEAKWEKEDEGYEVEFFLHDKEMEILYSENGKMIEMEEEISVSEVPESLVKALVVSYPGMEITQAERITIDDATLYELELVKDNIKLTSVFDEQGNLIEEEDDDD